MRLTWWTKVVAVLAVCAGSSSPVAAQTPAPSDPRPVVANFEVARTAGDVDAAMLLFADNAVVTVQGQPPRLYSGKEQVRLYLQMYGTRFRTLMRSNPQVLGNSVTWTERDEASQQVYDASVVATVGQGHIISLIYRLGDPTGAPLLAAAAAAERPANQLPSVAWPLGLSLLGLVVLGFIFGRPRRPASRSELDGRLMLELRRQRNSHNQRRAA